MVACWGGGGGGVGLASGLSFVLSGCEIFYFPIGILGRVWYLIVSIPGLCPLSYFVSSALVNSAGQSDFANTDIRRCVICNIKNSNIDLNLCQSQDPHHIIFCDYILPVVNKINTTKPTVYANITCKHSLTLPNTKRIGYR